MLSAGDNSKVHLRTRSGLLEAWVNAVSGKGAGRQVDVHAQHDNRARPRFHTVSSVKRAKLWGSNVKCKVRRAEAYRLKCDCHM